MDNQDKNIVSDGALDEVSGGRSYGGIQLYPYRIVWGDTLSQLAVRFRTTVSFLAEVNGIPNPDKIREGAIIYVPNFYG